MELFKINLLKLVAEYEIHSDLFWNERLDFFALCNDVFYWGCADMEMFTSQEDVDLYECTIKDCKNLYSLGESHAVSLYVARKRKMRPQGAVYCHINPALHALFDACGPEREINAGNPIKLQT